MLLFYYHVFDRINNIYLHLTRNTRPINFHSCDAITTSLKDIALGHRVEELEVPPPERCLGILGGGLLQGEAALSPPDLSSLYTWPQSLPRKHLTNY